MTYEDLGASDTIPFAQNALADPAPLGRRSLVVYAPQGAARFSVTGEANRTDAPGVTTFTRERTPAEQDEPFAPERHERVPIVSYGPAERTWQQEVADYLDLIKPQLEGAASPAVTDLAVKLAGKAAGSRQKVDALTAYVQRELRYEAILFGRKAQVPETPDQTLTKRFGDCKAKSLLLHGLLRAAGLESSLVLVLSDGLFVEGIADRDQFDHMIVYVPGLGEDGFIDPTNEDGSPVLSAVSYLAGRRALILDRENPRLETIRSLRPSESSLSVQRTVTHSPERSSVEEAVTVTGRFAASWRGALSSRDRAQAIQMLAGELEDAGVDARITDYRVDAESDYAAPLVVYLSYTVPRRVGEAPPLAWPGWERSYNQLPSVQGRKSDFYIRSPMLVESVTRIRNVHPIVQPVDATFQPGELHLKASQDGPDTVVALRMIRNPGTYPVGDYDTFRAAVNQTLGTFGQPVQLPRDADDRR